MDTDFLVTSNNFLVVMESDTLSSFLQIYEQLRTSQNLHNLSSVVMGVRLICGRNLFLRTTKSLFQQTQNKSTRKQPSASLKVKELQSAGLVAETFA